MQASNSPVPSQSAQPAIATTAPAVADDGDRIEKPWVAQVKRVIGQTTQNPYELNKQFSALKADYMQKRYGKTIKLED